MNDDLFPNLEGAIACCEDAGYRVTLPRMNPDQRVAEAVEQIDLNIGLLRDAVRRGGSFRIPGVISGLVHKLREVPEHVLSREEAEAI